MRTILENTLCRVNAKTGACVQLYNDNTGWFIINKGTKLYRESAMTSKELLAYLKGIEDVYDFYNK